MEVKLTHRVVAEAEFMQFVEIPGEKTWHQTEKKAWPGPNVEQWVTASGWPLLQTTWMSESVQKTLKCYLLLHKCFLSRLLWDKGSFPKQLPDSCSPFNASPSSKRRSNFLLTYKARHTWTWPVFSRRMSYKSTHSLPPLLTLLTTDNLGNILWRTEVPLLWLRLLFQPAGLSLHVRLRVLSLSASPKTERHSSFEFPENPRHILTETHTTSFAMAHLPAAFLMIPN